jgi:hypothetical protein
MLAAEQAAGSTQEQRQVLVRVLATTEAVLNHNTAGNTSSPPSGDGVHCWQNTRGAQQRRFVSDITARRPTGATIGAGRQFRRRDRMCGRTNPRPRNWRLS